MAPRQALALDLAHDLGKKIELVMLGADTELYLGLVHASDGAAGTKRRMAAARKYVPEFGIATECGMARARSEETVRTLLKIHADICASD